MNLKLTQCIIDHIVQTVLSKKDCLNKQIISIQYDEYVINHPLYSGFLSLTEKESPKIHLLLLDLSFPADNNYICIFQDEKNHIIILKWIDDTIEMQSRFSDQSFTMNVMQEAEFLFHFEKIINYGSTFYPENKLSSMFDLLNSILDG